jgi:hypothetical protein
MWSTKRPVAELFLAEEGASQPMAIFAVTFAADELTLSGTLVFEEIGAPV